MIGTAAGIALGAGALASGIGNAVGGGQSQTTTFNDIGPSALEKELSPIYRNQLLSMNSFFSNGADSSDLQAGTNAQRELAAIFGQYTKSGGLPTQNDLNQATLFSNDLFKARQVQLQQGFDDALMQSHRDLASRGMDPNDPVFRARLLQDLTRNQDVLGAEKQGFIANYAQQLPAQRLQFAQQRAQILGNLGDQAIQNKLQLLGLGSQAIQQERDWRRIASGSTTTQSSGNPFSNFISGAVGGLGAGVGVMNGFQSISNGQAYNKYLQSLTPPPPSPTAGYSSMTRMGPIGY